MNYETEQSVGQSVTVIVGPGSLGQKKTGTGTTKMTTGCVTADQRINGSTDQRATHGSTDQRINRHALGLTLIEVLVAVSLLSLLSVALVTALQVGAGAWQSARERLMLDRRIATANAILHAEIAGIVPIQAERPAGLGGGPRRLIFFQGETISMRFVTNYSLTAGARGGLRIVELQVANSPGGRRILLNEAPYRGPLSVGQLVLDVIRDTTSLRARAIFPPIRPRATSLIIADQLAACRFSYLKRGRNRLEPSVWVSQWDELNRIPAAVRVQLTPQADQARLLPVTITAPIRAQFPSESGRRRRRS